MGQRQDKDGKVSNGLKMKNEMKLRLAARTHVGMVREHNEDNFIISSSLNDSNWSFDNTSSVQPGEHGSLLVVADGMGGANAGEVASKVAIDSVRDYFTSLIGHSPEMSEKFIQESLKDAIIQANDKVVARQKSEPDTEGMGTTLIIVWLLKGQLHCAWTGDSRCYVYNPNLERSEQRFAHFINDRPSSNHLLLVSKDHSYVQELVDKGKIEYDQAFYHPENHIVSQSLGSEERPPEPDAVSFDLADGDRLILCSDGLNGMLTDPEIAEWLSNTYETTDCIHSLIEAANEAGGHDNITLILAEVEETGTFQATPEEEPEMIIEAPPSNASLTEDNNEMATVSFQKPEMLHKDRKQKSILLAIIVFLIICLAFSVYLNLSQNKVFYLFNNSDTDTITIVINPQERYELKKKNATILGGEVEVIPFINDNQTELELEQASSNDSTEQNSADSTGQTETQEEPQGQSQSSQSASEIRSNNSGGVTGAEETPSTTSPAGTGPESDTGSNGTASNGDEVTNPPDIRSEEPVETPAIEPPTNREKLQAFDSIVTIFRNSTNNITEEVSQKQLAFMAAVESKLRQNEISDKDVDDVCRLIGEFTKAKEEADTNNSGGVEYERAFTKLKQEREELCGASAESTGGGLVALLELNPDMRYSIGLAAVRNQSGRWGYIDKGHTLVIPFKYERAYMFSESDSLAAVKLGGKWGFIDQHGNAQVPFQFKNALKAFNGGKAQVLTQNNEIVTINTIGEVTSN